MPDEIVVRLCPECGARVNGPAAAFAGPQKCPKCANRVQFRDIPNDPPNVSPDPPETPRPDLLDYAAYACLGFGVLTSLAGLGYLLSGDAVGAAILAVVLLALGAIPLASFARFRADLIQSTAEVERLQLLLQTRERELSEAVSLWKGFKTNFDTLAADAKKAAWDDVSKLQEEARRRIEIASERDATVDRLGKRLLSDNRKWVQAKLTPNNFATQRDRLTKVIDFCRKHEYEVPAEFEKELLAELQTEFQAVLRRDFAKQEQARIKAQIRDEQRAEREIEAERKRIAAEQAAIARALEEALKATTDEHSAEIEALREKLREAEERGQRALSMAQQTKAGHIYVISNIGSFGEGVYKVGMTRRLEPMDRVVELGDASVPFPFDVHMMISCDDAPSLENALHKALHECRVNRVNLRKEFFRTDIESLRDLVEKHHGEVDYVAEPEALQYRETLGMSEEDYAFVTSHAEEFGGGDSDDDNE